MAIARNISINDETYELEPSKGQRVYVGTCSTAAATNPKVCTVETFPVNGIGKPYKGTEIVVKFTATNTSTSTTPELNVNGTGAIRIWYNNAVLASAKSAYAGYANRYLHYVYDGTYWVFMGHSVDNNSTYSNVALGQGYAVQNNSAVSATITAALGSYALTVNGIVSVKFLYDVPANATLNINSKGAKAIYNKDAAITSGVIKAGDTATFIYNTYYRLISVDRWQDKQDAISDLAAIRSGASKGATAIQQADLANVATSGSYNDLSNKPTIPTSSDINAAKPLIVNISHTGSGDNKVYSASETYNTICTAISNGRDVIAYYEFDGYSFVLDYYAEADSIYFTSVQQDVNRIYRLQIDSDETVHYFYSSFQSALTFDNSPTQNSNNPVKSGGVYTALQGKQDQHKDIFALFFGMNLPTSEANARVLTSAEQAIVDDMSTDDIWTCDGFPAGLDTDAYVASGKYKWVSYWDENYINVELHKTNDNKYWLESSFTTLLKSTDISDWAKASTKPSYTASEISGLATVATSGSYNDLADKPTIPAAYDDTALAARVTVLEGQTHNVTYNQSTTTLTIQ